MQENFNLKEINEMSKKDQIKYIDKYFFPIDDGTHAMFKDGKYTIIDTPTLKSTYFNRMPKELNKYYFHEKLDIKKIIYDLNKPILTDTEINLCPRKMHEYKPYKEFDEKTKQCVELMLFHIKDVLCDGKENVYIHFVKWLANVTKGNKNDCCIYLKGAQGAGKTTLFDFMRFHVIGKGLCLETGSSPIRSKFNKELEGKLLVMFEELENFSVAEWASISSILKRIITSITIMIEGKGVDAIERVNLNNYVLLSNNDAIQDDDGRRYFIMPINCKRLGDTVYFDNIRDRCFNDVVGHAFYCYLLEIDLKGYYAQKYPVTQSKLDSVAKRLDSVYKFLKEEYVLNGVGIDKVKVDDLHKQYQNYCNLQSFKIKGKIDFNATLKNIAIIPKPSNGSNYYTCTYESLREMADKFHWVHELDEDPQTDVVIEESMFLRRKKTTNKKKKPNNSIVVDEIIEDFLTPS